MKKAALLIDYDNLMKSLGNQDYNYTVSEIYPQLVEKAREEARIVDAYLESIVSYQPDGSIPVEEMHKMRNFGIEFTGCTKAKNAADTVLIFEAAEYLFQQDYSVFFVVSGDVDFIDLAHSLGDRHAKCFLWPASKYQRMNKLLRDYKDKSFVVELLNLINNPLNVRDLQKIFLLSVQKLANDGTYLGSYNNGQEMLKKLQFMEPAEVEAVWRQAVEDGSLYHEPVSISDKFYGNRWRLRYERPDVLQLFRTVDAILDRVSWRSDPVSRGDIKQSLHDLEDDSTYVGEIIDLMEKCGFLIKIGDTTDYKLDSPSQRFGILRCAYRIVTIIWSQTLEHRGQGWVGVGFTHINREWPRHAKGGGAVKNMNSADLDYAKKQLEKLLKQCQAMGAIVHDKDARPQFRVNWNHPVAKTVELNARKLFPLLNGFSENSVSEEKLIDEMKAISLKESGSLPLFGPINSECKFWLGVFAAGKHIFWTNHQISLIQRSPLVRLCLEKESGTEQSA